MYNISNIIKLREPPYQISEEIFDDFDVELDQKTLDQITENIEKLKKQCQYCKKRKNIELFFNKPTKIDKRIIPDKIECTKCHTENG